MVAEKKELKIIKVNYFFDDIYTANNKKLDLRSKLFQRYKPRLIDIFCKFLKFLILKLGKKPHKIDVKKG
jgi:hypothetical protein